MNENDINWNNINLDQTVVIDKETKNEEMLSYEIASPFSESFGSSLDRTTL